MRKKQHNFLIGAGNTSDEPELRDILHHNWPVIVKKVSTSWRSKTEELWLKKTREIYRV